MIKFDALDLRILDLLQEDAYATHKEIASKLNMTTTPIFERIKRLERDGIIRKYTAVLDRQKLGLKLAAFCDVQLKVHSTPFLEKFELEIQSIEEVQEVYHIAGMYDYLLKVVVKDMESYQAFVSKKLAALDNIGRVQSSFVMKEISHTTRFKLD
ncbi:MAG: Lrp/AsnC family transcriptional regulator [Saprospiraceae bacterium]|nr:Lrp/AsnC family transcriptional regulator [Saprospiraceae bacterium]MCF8251611.1 Lrp/AsnC family transcriptional regulator [Saprospiraceae bacterium]MCF8281332.1 Lrp/AsnC family transcriptional regulator [Bacteroidales bacterium]MCF8312299.1 Lrp/AsnC family transcriptional regulator [Saprospiraceae bacterium]MCF8442007.1 Lrp/AsnC family transcriptional regulator [Saprospiraceae bacterium]